MLISMKYWEIITYTITLWMRIIVFSESFFLQTIHINNVMIADLNLKLAGRKRITISFFVITKQETVGTNNYQETFSDEGNYSTIPLISNNTRNFMAFTMRELLMTFLILCMKYLRVVKILRFKDMLNLLTISRVR